MLRTSTWRKARATLVFALLISGIYLAYTGCAVAMSNERRITEIEQLVRYLRSR